MDRKVCSFENPKCIYVCPCREWMIKAVVQKEHPFQSHIQRYAMFPSYESPDDPHTGVRAAATLPLNPLLPSSAPAVTVLHKTKGYRQHTMFCVPLKLPT